MGTPNDGRGADLRATTVRALAGLGERVLPRIEPLLADPDPRGRVAAAKLLADAQLLGARPPYFFRPS